MARVILTEDAREDLRDLDGDVRRKVLRKPASLRTDPDRRGAPLGSRTNSNLSGLRKISVGDRDWRIVYCVDRVRDVVLVLVVAARADSRCYELVQARMATWKTSTAEEEMMRQLLHNMDQRRRES